MKSPSRDRIGATRGKLALVGVLAVALAYVMASNVRALRGAGMPAVAAPAVAAATSDMVSTPEQPFGEFGEDDDWPRVSWGQAAQFDPFRAPPWMARAEPGDAVATETRTLEALRKAQSVIVVVADGERLARIGDHEFRVGDFVGPYQIIDISSAGIELSEPVAAR